MTIQRCDRCDDPTGRCEDDSIYLGDRGPFCSECSDSLKEEAVALCEEMMGQLHECALAEERVREIHAKAKGHKTSAVDPHHVLTYDDCGGCRQGWPCPTIRALGSPSLCGDGTQKEEK